MSFVMFIAVLCQHWPTPLDQSLPVHSTFHFTMVESFAEDCAKNGLDPWIGCYC